MEDSNSGQVKVNLEPFKEHLRSIGLSDEEIKLVRVQFYVNNTWKDFPLNDTKWLPREGILAVRVKVGEDSKWVESSLILEESTSEGGALDHGYMYAILVACCIFLVFLCVLLFLTMKYIQLQRRERDKGEEKVEA